LIVLNAKQAEDEQESFFYEEMKIAYVKSQVSETTIKHIALRMRNMITNSFLEAEKILSIINKMYDDFDQHHTAQ